MSRRSSRRRKPSAAALEAQENAKALAAMPATPPPPPKKAKKTPTAPKKKIKAKQSTLSMDISEEDDITIPEISEKDWKRIKSDPTKDAYISLEKYVNNENPSVREFSETIDHMVNNLHKGLVIPDVGEYVKNEFQTSPIKKIVVLGSPAIGKSSVVRSLLLSLQGSRATKPEHSPDDMKNYRNAVTEMYSDPLRDVVVSLPENWIVCNNDFTRDAGEYKANHTPITLQKALMTDNTHTIFDVASTLKLQPLLTSQFPKEQVLYVIVYAPFLDNIGRMVGRCRKGKRCFRPIGESYKSIYNDFISEYKGTKNIVIIKNTKRSSSGEKRPSSGEKRRAGLKKLFDYLAQFKSSTLKSAKSCISNRRKTTIKNRKKHNTR